MLFAFLFLVFAGTAAGLWFHGAWKNAMYLINILLAGIIATNFFEPLATMLDGFQPGLTYLFDFLMLWILFAVAFLILRLLTDMAGQGTVKFPLPAEMALRTVLALWSGWIMVCFTAFTLHTAPLNAVDPFGGFTTPMEGSFLGMAPDLQWMGFAHSRSAGALSRGNFEPGQSDGADQEADVQPFDSNGEFIYKYHQRRVNFAAEESIMIPQ